MMTFVPRRIYRPGVRWGLAIGMLGAILYIGAAVPVFHAARAPVVAGGEQFSFIGPGPVHLVGLSEPGDVDAPAAQCIVSTPAGTEAIKIGIRESPGSSIGPGRFLSGQDNVQVTITCDRRVAVSTGRLVPAYPVASSRSLGAVSVTMLVGGLAYAWLRARQDPAVAARGHTLALIRLIGIFAGLAALTGLVLIIRRDAGGMIYLAVAVALGGMLLMIRKFQRRRGGHATDLGMRPTT